MCDRDRDRQTNRQTEMYQKVGNLWVDNVKLSVITFNSILLLPCLNFNTIDIKYEYIKYF